MRVLYEKLRKPNYHVDRLNKSEFLSFVRSLKKDLGEKEILDLFPIFARKGLDNSLRIKP